MRRDVVAALNPTGENQGRGRGGPCDVLLLQNSQNPPTPTPCCDDLVETSHWSLLRSHYIPASLCSSFFQFAEWMFLALQCLWWIVHLLRISFFNFFSAAEIHLKPASYSMWRYNVRIISMRPQRQESCSLEEHNFLFQYLEKHCHYYLQDHWENTDLCLRSSIIHTV